MTPVILMRTSLVVDVGRKQDNTWTVIELTDGCISGISMIDPETLYCNLAKKLYT